MSARAAAGDAELVMESLRGDPDAFSLLVRRHLDYFQLMLGYDAGPRTEMRTELPRALVRAARQAVTIFWSASARAPVFQAGARPRPPANVFEPLGMSSTMYNPPSRLRSRVAPTEFASFQKTRGEEGKMDVGDEYLGHHPKLGPWRDTHVEVRGPVVQAIQFAFLFAMVERLSSEALPAILGRHVLQDAVDLLVDRSGPQVALDERLVHQRCDAHGVEHELVERIPLRRGQAERETRSAQGQALLHHERQDVAAVLAA